MLLGRYASVGNNKNFIIPSGTKIEFIVHMCTEVAKRQRIEAKLRIYILLGRYVVSEIGLEGDNVP